MVSVRPARSGKSAPGALEAEIDDFEQNSTRKSMVLEMPARSRQYAPGALKAEIDDFEWNSVSKPMVPSKRPDLENLFLGLWGQKMMILKRV